MESVLDRLLSPDFAIELGLGMSPNVIRRNLLDSDTVRQLRRAIHGGLVTEADIQHFVAEIERQFEKGRRFPHEPALAAIAVALENQRTEFVADFYIDLCRLRHLAEFEFAPEVAVLSTHIWSQLPETKTKKVTFGVKLRQRFWTDMNPGMREIPTETHVIERRRFKTLETGTNAAA